MNKQIYKEVTERSKGFCEGYRCNNYIGEEGELHHAIGGSGKRTQHESVDTCFKLCSSCHERVDKDIYTRLYFQLMAQINLMRKYPEEEVRQRLGGKLYG